MKKFVGYYIIGAANEQDAQDEKGLLLWSTKKPGTIARLFNKWLLNLYWVDKEKELEEKGFRQQRKNNTQIYKVSPPNTHDNEKARFSSRRGFRGNKDQA